jgi:hypothetical protein
MAIAQELSMLTMYPTKFNKKICWFQNLEKGKLFFFFVLKFWMLQPFAKPRKASTRKKKPEGWTYDQWQQDCLRPKMSMAERRGRRAAQQEKKTMVARAQQYVLATCIETNNASPCSTSPLVYIPGLLSP